jgi:hypothetical protein
MVGPSPHGCGEPVAVRPARRPELVRQREHVPDVLDQGLVDLGRGEARRRRDVDLPRAGVAGLADDPDRGDGLVVGNGDRGERVRRPSAADTDVSCSVSAPGLAAAVLAYSPSRLA